MSRNQLKGVLLVTLIQVLTLVLGLTLPVIPGILVLAVGFCLSNYVSVNVGANRPIFSRLFDG